MLDVCCVMVVDGGETKQQLKLFCNGTSSQCRALVGVNNEPERFYN